MNLKKALNLYSSTSGQMINQNKISLYFINTPILRQSKIANILGFSIGSFPCIYLGLPLGPNPSDSFLEDLIKTFNKKLAGWKGNLLSQDGKIILLKACLQSIPTYALRLFRIPAKYVDTIDKIKKELPMIWF